MIELSPADLARAIDRALEEDLGGAGDVTTDAVVRGELRGVGRFVARERLILAGLPVARAVFAKLDPESRFTDHAAEGESIREGRVFAEVRGDARAILRGERTALNFLMRMSGIATATRNAVDEVAGGRARILDTRKTAPGLRLLDKYAVACGGGVNHRMGLYDAVMIKDTHLGVVPSIPDAVRRALAAGHPAERITVEVRNRDELSQAIAAGAGRALLDNMELPEIREAVRIAAGRIVLEASGGLRPGRLRPVAEAGVDCMSLGWLTHSARAADLALETELEETP